MRKPKKNTTHCPTCGKIVDKLRAGAVGIFSGKFMYFCSKECKKLFATSSPRATAEIIKKSAPEQNSSSIHQQSTEKQAKRVAPPKKTTFGEKVTEEKETLSLELDYHYEDHLPALAVEEKTKAWIAIFKKFHPPLMLFTLILIVEVSVITLVIKLSLIQDSSKLTLIPAITAVCFQFLISIYQLKTRFLPVIGGEFMIIIAFALYCMGAINSSENSAGFCSTSSPPIFTLIFFTGLWLSRKLEMVIEAKLSSYAKLQSIFEGERIKNFLRSHSSEISPIASYSRKTSYALLFISISVILITIVISTIKHGTAWHYEAILFASTLSISFSPRLFINNLLPAAFSSFFNAKQNSISFKNEREIDKAATVSGAIFLKRGGIAEEKTQVVEMINVGKMLDASLLSLCYSCEDGISGSEIAEALCEFARKKDIKPADIRLRRFYPGKGLHCTSPYGEIILGSRNFLMENTVSLAMVEEIVRDRERRGHTVVFMSVGRKVQCLFILSNAIKKGAEEVVEILYHNSITPILLSGDSRRTIEAIAKKTGIEQIRAEVTSATFESEISRVRNMLHRIAIIGKLSEEEITSHNQDLLIKVKEEKSSNGQLSIYGMICKGKNLKIIGKGITIAKRYRKLVLISTGIATAMQALLPALVLSGLVNFLIAGITINLTGALLYFIHAKMHQAG